MEINSAIINGLFLLFGVLLSSGINYLLLSKDSKLKEAKRDIKMLAKQSEAFWCLEQSYLNYISQISIKDKPKTIQSKRRMLLSLDPKLDKITATPASMKKILEKWEL